jgi:GPH family glycoside/pentoside/hexuronide:cation symporter
VTVSSPSERIPARIKILFSTGDLTTSLPLTIIGFFQLFFLTDVARLDPATAGWIVAIAKIWDAVNDPLYGVLADRIRTPWGRRRGPMVLAAVPLGLSFMLMWLVPQAAHAWLIAYYIAVFILFDACFTVYHVSYNSLTPVLTGDYDERSSLNGVRMVFQLAGALGSVIFLTVAGWFVTDKRTLFAAAGVLLGVVSILPPFLTFAVTRGRDSPGSKTALAPLPALRATLVNRPFRFVVGTYLLSWTTASIMSSVLVYFASYYLRRPAHANYLVLTAEGSALAFIPVVVLLARTLDKRRAFIIGAASWLVVLLAISALPPGSLVPAYGLAFLSGLGIATAYVVPWSMIPDIIEHDQVATGERREGSYYAFAAFFQKLGTGFALWLMGQALGLTGYLTPSAAAAVPEQPLRALAAIRLFMGPVPAVLLGASIAVCAFFPISRESHRQTQETIAAREAAASRATGSE